MKTLVRRFTKAPILSVLFLLLLGCSLGVGEKHAQLADEYIRQGKYLSAVEEYTRVVNYGGRSPLAIKAQQQIAFIYDNYLKDFPRAIRAYKDLYKRATDARIKMEARWAIARIYAERLENPIAAADEYRGLYQNEAKDQKEAPQICLAWAKALMDSGRFKDAAEVFEEFRKTFPAHRDGPRVLLDEASAYLADRRGDEAKQRYRELIEKLSGQVVYNSIIAEAYYGLGNALELNEDLDAALAAYRQSLSMYPNPAVVELKIQRVEKRKKERRL